MSGAAVTTKEKAICFFVLGFLSISSCLSWICAMTLLPAFHGRRVYGIGGYRWIHHFDFRIAEVDARWVSAMFVLMFAVLPVGMGVIFGKSSDGRKIKPGTVIALLLLLLLGGALNLGVLVIYGMAGLEGDF